MRATDLCEAHELQLQSFLRFSQLKRQQHQREILQCIDESRDSIEAGEMFSSSEMKQLLEGIRDELSKYISKEIDSAYHSSALLVKLQLDQAQQAGVSIGVDTSLLESEMLLQQIRACEATALRRPASDYTAKRGALGGLAGGPLRPVADPAAAAAVQREQLLVTEADALRARLDAMQAAASTARAEQAETARQLKQAQELVAVREAEAAQARNIITQLEKAAAISAVDTATARAAADRSAVVDAGAAMEAAQATVAAATQELAFTRRQLEEARSEVAALQKLLDGKLQDSKQWHQLKLLLQQKSQEVLSLRKQLAKYEPHNFLSE